MSAACGDLRNATRLKRQDNDKRSEGKQLDLDITDLKKSSAPRKKPEPPKIPSF